MSESLRDFVISYSFSTDRTSMARAEAESKAAEDRIVANNAAAVAKRIAADRKEQRERIDAIVKANGELSQEDRRFVAEDLKRHQDAEAAKNKAQDESFKRQRQRFDEIAKASRQFALNITGVVTGVVAAIGASTGGLLTTTDRAAKQFERLKYMAQSSGATVRGIQAFGFGIAQLGGNAEAAEQQLAEFGNKLQTFPQFAKNLESMGIATRDAGGHMRDAAEIAKDYFAVLEKMPRAQQDALGEVYGFAPDTIRAGTRPGLGTYMADERARRAAIGADGDLSGERGVAFERSMRRLTDDIASVKMRIETALMALFKPALDTVAKWIEEHGKAISTTVIAISRGISDVVSAFVNTGIVKDSMKALSDGLEEFAGYISSGDFKKDIKGFVHDLGQLAKAMRWCLEKLGILDRTQAAVVPNPTGSGDMDGEGSGAGASLRNRRGGLGHQTADDEHFAGVRARKDAFDRSITAVSKDLSPEARALLDTLASGEAKDYNVLNGGDTFDSYARHPGGRAAGRYQFLPSTWSRVQQATGAQDFGPEAQDKGAWWLAQSDYKKRTGRDLQADLASKDPATIAGVGRALGPTWVSLSGQFGSKYDAFLKRQAAASTSSADGTAAGDLSGGATYSHGQLDGVKGFIVHHTAGRGSPEGVVQTLNQRGLGVQFVMDRDGKIYQTLPNGARGAHIKHSQINDLDNSNTMGMEVIAKDDNDVTPAQVKAGKAFLDGLAKKYPGLQVFGHGEVNREKQPTEGHSIVAAYRAGRAAPATDPNYHPPSIPIEQRNLSTYMGRDTPAKVEVTDASAFKLGKAFVSSSPLLNVPSPRHANTLADLQGSWLNSLEGMGLKHHPWTHSPAEAQRRMSTNNVRHGDRTVNHSPTYNVHTSDVKAGLDAAKRQGERGAADLVRNIQPMLT